MQDSTREVKKKVKAIYDRILVLMYVDHAENLREEIEKAIEETKDLFDPALSKVARAYISGHVYSLMRMR